MASTTLSAPPLDPASRREAPTRQPRTAMSSATTTTTATTSSSCESANRSYASDADAEETIRDLRRRLRTAKEDREHYRSLYKRAETAFVGHRHDLEGLVASERESRLKRQLELREALQRALDDSRGVLAKIESLRAEQEDAVRQGLEQVRTAHGKRTTELEQVITTLRAECAEVARHSQDALAARDEEEYALEQALRLQVSLHDELQKVKDLVLQVHSRPRARSTTCHAASSPLRHRRCSGDVDPVTGPARSPVRQRIFLPSGHVNESPERRAPSPASHHVLSLLSTIQRQNYLRPRAYEARHGRQGEGRELLDDGRDDDSTGAWREPYHHRETSSPFSRRLRVLESEKLAAAEAELVGGPAVPHSTWPAEAPLAPSQDPHATTLPRPGTTSTEASKLAAASSPYSRGFWVPATSAHRPSAVRRRSTPPHLSSPYHGRRVNALVRALLDEVRDMRTQYAWYQSQLRDPCGDSVEASQQMRRLMRAMDEKVDQVRALRAAQSQKSNQLRWRETMQDIQLDNAYSEDLYHRLRNL